MTHLWQCRIAALGSSTLDISSFLAGPLWNSNTMASFREARCVGKAHGRLEMSHPAQCCWLLTQWVMYASAVTNSFSSEESLVWVPGEVPKWAQRTYTHDGQIPLWILCVGVIIPTSWLRKSWLQRNWRQSSTGNSRVRLESSESGCLARLFSAVCSVLTGFLLKAMEECQLPSVETWSLWPTTVLMLKYHTCWVLLATTFITH